MNVQGQMYLSNQNKDLKFCVPTKKSVTKEKSIQVLENKRVWCSKSDEQRLSTGDQITSRHRLERRFVLLHHCTTRGSVTWITKRHTKARITESYSSTGNYILVSMLCSRLEVF